MNAAAHTTTASLDVALAHASDLLAREPLLAAEQALEIIRSVGPHPHARLILGMARLALADVDGALAVLDPLAAEQPRWAFAQLQRGLALEQAGRGDEALAAVRLALELKPDLPQAWLALGNHLAGMGDARGAEAAFAQQMRHSCRDPALLAAAGDLCDNRVPEAEARLRAHLLRSPNDAPALRMLAEAVARMGRPADAERLLERCLALAPEFLAARLNYATLLHRANKPEQALAELDRVLAAEPGNPNARNLKAVVLCVTGDYAAALDLYRGLLQQYPGQARIWMSYGHAAKTAGEFEQAVTAYRRCIALEPGSGEAYWSLANLKTYRFPEDEQAAMREQLRRSDLAVEERAQFEFALGKAGEDAADYAAAFDHYQRGNALRRSRSPYHREDARARIRRSMELFDQDFLSSRQGAGCNAADPIFVLGLPRAGSTLVEQILSSHPEVEGTMELPEVIAITRELRGAGSDAQGSFYHEALARLQPAQLAALGERYLANTRVHRKTAAPRFVDKMPNNFLHVGLIHLMLPNARIIDVRRHPLACCFSGFKQYFARGQNFSYGLEDIGSFYADYVALMAHFDAVLPGRVHRVIYEDLVEDTEAQVRRLLAHCGLPYDPACLRFHENKRAVRTASSEQVRRPINRDGIDHWRHFEPWLGPLKQALGPVLDHYPAVPPDILDTFLPTT